MLVIILEKLTKSAFIVPQSNSSCSRLTLMRNGEGFQTLLKGGGKLGKIQAALVKFLSQDNALWCLLSFIPNPFSIEQNILAIIFSPFCLKYLIGTFLLNGKLLYLYKTLRLNLIMDINPPLHKRYFGILAPRSPVTLLGDRVLTETDKLNEVFSEVKWKLLSHVWLLATHRL